MNYQKSIRYASRLTPNAKDLAHDAFILWYNKTGSNLFEKPSGEIARVLKNVHFNQDRGNKWYWNGTIQEKSFSDADTLGGEDTPFVNEDVDKFKNSLSEFDNKVLELKLQGYQNQEIERILKRSNPTITAAIKRMQLNNPFNGSRVKITKRVKRKTFETNPNYLEEFEMGDESDYNEYYTLMTSKENPLEGLLIREE